MHTHTHTHIYIYIYIHRPRPYPHFKHKLVWPVSMYHDNYTHISHSHFKLKSVGLFFYVLQMDNTSFGQDMFLFIFYPSKMCDEHTVSKLFVFNTAK